MTRETRADVRSGSTVQDLTLLDAVLCTMVVDGNWQELEYRYHATWEAVGRLRAAFKSGEHTTITASLAAYFRQESEVMRWMSNAQSSAQIAASRIIGTGSAEATNR